MKMAKGQKAMFPKWLAPTQLRLIPVSDKHLDGAKKLMEKISGYSVRVDLDDRSETLGKKIRDAQKEWIPYIAVIGDKELESDKLAVTIRETDQKADLPVNDLIATIEKDNAGKPFAKLSLSQYLSKRPII